MSISGQSLPKSTPGSLIQASKKVLIAVFVMLMVFQGVKLWVTVLETKVTQIADPSKPTNFEDYVVFYTAGRMVVNGEAASLYNVEALREAEQDVLGRPIDAPEDAGVLPYFNPPFFAVLMVPLSLLPLDISTAVSFVLVCFLAVVCALNLVRILGLRGLQGMLVIIWFLSWHSTAVAVVQTQLTMLAFLAWLGFVLFEMRGQHGRSGLALALTLAKPQFLVLVLPLLVWRRRWRTLATISTIGALLAAASLLVTGPDVLIDYPKLLLESSQWEHRNSIDPSSMYGWGGFFRRSFGLSDLPLMIISGAASLATIASVVYLFRRGWNPGQSDFAPRAAVILMASLLISFHFYRQDLTLVPLALVLGAWHSRESTGSWGVWPYLAALGSVVQYLDINYLFEGGTNIQTPFIIGLIGVLAWRGTSASSSVHELEGASERKDLVDRARAAA